MNTNDIKFLSEQKEFFKQIHSIAESQINAAPAGVIHAFRKKDKYYFYINDPSIKNQKRKYLRKDNPLVKILAQKKYNTEVLSATKKQIRTIDTFLKNYSPDILKKLYKQIPPWQKELIQPAEVSDDEYAKNWASEVYAPSSFSPDYPEYYTKKGERVRSKTEKIIADTLAEAGIPYHYEYPLKMKNGEVFRPDFIILNKRTRKIFVLEHFGMMDNPEYANRVLEKIHTYMQNGFFPGEQLLITAETRAKPFSAADFELIIHHYFL